MICECGSERLIEVGGKCSDLFYAYQPNIDKEYDGYVPRGIGIGGGDDIQFTYCLDCGQIQNWKPAKDLGDEEE